jgi:hypothetical protein
MQERQAFELFLFAYLLLADFETIFLSVFRSNATFRLIHTVSVWICIRFFGIPIPIAMFALN